MVTVHDKNNALPLDADAEASGESETLTSLTHGDTSEATKTEAAEHAASTWNDSQRWLTVTTACLVCFVAGMNATGILAATEQIANEFHVDLASFDYSYFLVTAWNAGAAVVPLFVLPMMEDLGILPIYYTVYFVFVMFVVAQAVAPNFATLVVSRVIAGSCGGVLQNCVDGIIADVWGSDIHGRTLCVTVYIFALLGGVTIGPVVGGWIIKFLDWRWILYVQLMIYGAITPYVILTLRDPRAGAKSAAKQNKKEVLRNAVNETVFRAIRMLCTEFILSSITLLSSFAFGVVFIMTQSIPQVFSTLYDWTSWQTGVVQVSIFIGEIIGLAICFFQDTIVYPRLAYSRGSISEVNIEARLYTCIPCSIFGLAVGFFIYGWTSHADISWILPSFGLMLIGVGIMCIVQAVSTYVTDCYASVASSAISGVAFGENIFAAFLPLATRTMYKSIGFQWASSLLGFASLVLSMAPVVLVFFGRRLRSQSKFVD